MIGNIYRNHGSSHSKNNSYKSFLYTGMHDDSCRTLDFSLGPGGFESLDGSDSDYSGSSFASDDDDNDLVGDRSQVSFMVGDDDNLDELEKALEAYAMKEERQAAKEKQRRRRSNGTTSYNPSTTRGTNATSSTPCSNGGLDPKSESDHSRRGASNAGANLPRCSTMPEQRARPTYLLQRKDSSRSLSSNKSLTLGALAADSKKNARRSGSNGVTKTLSSSNRSLLSLCPPKDQLQNVFGTPADDFKTFNWNRYFQPMNPTDIGTMSTELERAISSKKLKRLQRLHEKGVSMTARNKQGETVVHLVCRHGCAEMLIYLIQQAKVSVRVRDSSGKTALHEVAWSPNFNPSIAMMLVSDSPELLWAPDTRGFLALDYVPRRTMSDWYDFLEVKTPMLRLALKFSQFKASSAELNRNQEKLRSILERQLQTPDKDRP